MTRDAIIADLYESGYIIHLLRKRSSVPAERMEDAAAFCFEAICRLPNGRLEDIFERDGMDGIRKFVAMLCLREVSSRRSRYYRNMCADDRTPLISESRMDSVAAEEEEGETEDRCTIEDLLMDAVVRFGTLHRCADFFGCTFGEMQGMWWHVFRAKPPIYSTTKKHRNKWKQQKSK